MDIISEINKRHLNLPKIFELDEKNQKIVFQLFDKLNKCVSGNNGVNIPPYGRIDMINAKLIYDTLVEYGFLVTRREKNINELLDDPKDV